MLLHVSHIAEQKILQCSFLFFITQYHFVYFYHIFFQIGTGSRTDPLRDSALSASSTPAYHRSYREPQAQSGSE